MDPVNALLALSRLDALPRTGWILAGVPAPERVSGHILGVAFLALALGPAVQPSLDMLQVLTQAVVHDAPEALSGDLPKLVSMALPPGAKAAMERSLAETLFAGFPPLAAVALAEYAAQTTREARFVKACDRLQLALECHRLQTLGQKGLDDFVLGLTREDWSEFEPVAEFWGRLAGRLTLDVTNS